MENKNKEIDSNFTPTKAMRNLTDSFELQGQRLNIIEQQFLELAARVTGIEGPKFKSRSLR